MVSGRTDAETRAEARLKARVALWAVMAAAIFWTLLYQASQKDADVPEFVYVNF